jgi:hypothetical protein
VNRWGYRLYYLNDAGETIAERGLDAPNETEAIAKGRELALATRQRISGYMVVRYEQTERVLVAGNLRLVDRDDKCEQFILPENRYCDQPAVYHDEIRGQAYCEEHAAAWAKWRGDETPSHMEMDDAVRGTPYAPDPRD